MTTERHPFLRRLLFDDPSVDADTLVEFIEQLGQLGEPESMYGLQDIARALPRCIITLDQKLRGHDIDEHAVEACQRVFWQLVALGLAHERDEAALVVRDALKIELATSPSWSQSSGLFARYARGDAGEQALKQLDLRIIESPALPVEERLNVAIASFPVGASSLEPLLDACPQSAEVGRSIIITCIRYPGHPMLSRELFEKGWRSLYRYEDRAGMRGLLVNSPHAHAHANSQRWGEIFLATAFDDHERASLFSMRHCLHDMRWSMLAGSLLSSKNPEIYRRALRILEERASRDAIPALAAARADASRADRRRIDAIIRGIHQREPMPGDGDGALSLSEAAGGELSQAGEQGALSVVDAGAALAQVEAPGRAPLLRRMAASLLLLLALLLIVALIFGALS